MMILNQLKHFSQKYSSTVKESFFRIFAGVWFSFPQLLHLAIRASSELICH